MEQEERERIQRLPAWARRMVARMEHRIEQLQTDLEESTRLQARAKGYWHLDVYSGAARNRTPLISMPVRGHRVSFTDPRGTEYVIAPSTQESESGQLVVMALGGPAWDRLMLMPTGGSNVISLTTRPKRREEDE